MPAQRGRVGPAAAVYLPFPAGQFDLVVWVGIWGKCVARKEMPRAAHRELSRAATAMDGRAHAAFGGDGAKRTQDVCGGGVSQRVWQDEFCDVDSAEEVPGRGVEDHDGWR